mgnify:CR=1 FL=1
MRKPRGPGQRGSTYDVGYGKPPMATQFKPGQSGNPKGRKKGDKNLSTLVRNVLDEVIELSEGGVRRRLTKREVIARQIVNQAMKGDAKTTTPLFSMLRESGELEQVEATRDAKTHQEMKDEDLAILARFKKDIGG